MCGIAGFVGFENRPLLKKMTDIIRHRGPDDSGFFVDRNVCMGVRRLSIIDIKGGRQPVHNEDGDVHVVYNGEIYNFLQLKNALEKAGHDFYTRCDTEVLVHLYEEYGDFFVRKLEGMFAFALWDADKKKLLLGRDRFGKKPLYYCTAGGNFYFASEIKSILLDKNIPRKVNRNALSDFLSFRCAIGDETLFDGIKKLLPGHMLTCRKGRMRTKRYWKLQFNPEANSEKYYLDALRAALSDAVQKRLISEVPLGAYLSGGIDSSVVVALMSKFLEEPVRTFSVGFGSGYDETKYARIVSEHLGTNHMEFIVEKNSLGILPQVLWYMDEPIADPAAIPTYLLSQMAKRHVTVVLTGEGGDELFAGYFQYKVMGMLHKSRVPKWAFRAVKLVPSRLLNRVFQFADALGEEGLHRFESVLDSRNPGEQFLRIVSVFTDEEKKELGLASGKKWPAYSALNGTKFSLNKLLSFDIQTELPNDLLMKVDKTTMAFSIEAREPYMDHALAELTARMPETLKLRSMRDKYILRRLGLEVLPREIVKRKKHNFFVPLHEWKRDIVEAVDTLAEESGGMKYFNSGYINRIKQGLDNSELYYGRQLWSLLNFMLWHEIFIEGSGRKPRFRL